MDNSLESAPPVETFAEIAACRVPQERASASQAPLEVFGTCTTRNNSKESSVCTRKRSGIFTEKLAQKKAKLKAAQARIRARISVRERKRRTRRLILMGSYLELVPQDDPERKARLMKELDGFLERDRDRELFDLP